MSEEKSMLTFHYFNTKGRGYAALVGSAYWGKQLHWEKYSLDDWTNDKNSIKSKCAFGQLPILVDGEYTICQSNAIVRYLAKKWDKEPSSLKEYGLYESLIEESNDIFEVVVIANKKNQWESAWPKILSHFTNVQKLMSGNKFMTEILMADMALFSVVSIVLILWPKALDSFHQLQGWYNEIANNDAVKSLLASTPDYFNRKNTTATTTTTTTTTTATTATTGAQSKKIDLMGFGTMEHVDGSAKPEAMKSATLHALSTGYRTFDTGELYATTSFVGEAIEESKVPREELFIISKLKGLPSEEYKNVRERVEKLLVDLKIKHLDLLLIHWPGPVDLDWTMDPNDFIQKIHFDFFKKNIEKAWSNMLQLQKDGLTRQIGVSNFYQSHLDELLKYVKNKDDRPAANQIYIDLTHQEIEFVNYMQKEDIQVIAYRPIAFIGISDFIDSAELKEASKIMNTTDKRQLLLSTLMKKCICVIPKSQNPDHIVSNFRATDLLKNDKLNPDLLKSLDGNEMILSFGGQDEYALAFKNVTGTKR